jgi:hypothetical protein
MAARKDSTQKAIILNEASERQKKKDAIRRVRQDKKMEDGEFGLKPMYHEKKFFVIELFIAYFSLFEVFLY